MGKTALALAVASCLASYAGGASRAPVRAQHGMVASTSEIASQVGVDILKRGGNAVDAAVAVAFALVVTYPSAGNLGGGGFMLIHRSATGEEITIDYRERAPGRAHRDMYVDGEGRVAPEKSTVGHLAVAVPGTPAGLAMALEKYGTLKLEEALQPAIELAEKGFPVSTFLSDSLKRNESRLGRFPESRRIFLRGGKPYEPGELLVQKELAETLKKIARGGPKAFYEGKIARLIVNEMKSHGGWIALEDLKDYRPVLRPPVRGTYRGYEVVSMGPPSSGGIVLLQMLNQVEPFPLKELGPHSSKTLHLLAEAMRRAFADRARYLGDADYVKVPVKGLISKPYARKMRETFNGEYASSSLEVGPGDPFPYESEETTHFSVVDKDGNAVANTYTLNDSYGSGVTVRGAGFLLNNEMDDFTSAPGVPNMYGLIQGEANSIQGGKRPLSAMTPTFLKKDGKVLLIVGSPGGPTIINTVFQIILNVVNHGMSIQEAVDAPRIHHQWLPDVLQVEPRSLVKDVELALRSRGHQIRERGFMGDAQGIWIDWATGIRYGGSDPRQDGRPIGY
ncbi:MAG: gamma-glutamyltransferase [Acidobacteria bacterium]|nr:gamma-glutamyltransferase [Acidobacteriota bacterium]